MRKKLKEKQGFMVMAAYLFPVLIALLALVIEFNQIRIIKNELQVMVDAAALSGIQRAVVLADTIYENEYDDSGKLVGVKTVTTNYRIANDDLNSTQAAINTFLKNLSTKDGWGTDGTTRITVYPSEIYGEPLSSGLTTAVVGNGVPDNRLDFNDADEYYFYAKARIKTILIAPVIRALNTVANVPLPANGLNEIVIEAESKARTKAMIE
ncbi:MAG: TadE/TadG family type IV pilus assembly protein [Tepidibacillus sp.]